jgi:hypothetical protein
MCRKCIHIQDIRTCTYRTCIYRSYIYNTYIYSTYIYRTCIYRTQMHRTFKTHMLDFARDPTAWLGKVLAMSHFLATASASHRTGISFPQRGVQRCEKAVMGRRWTLKSEAID